MSTSNGAVALSVSGLNKSYGDFEVISNLDLQIQHGSIHGLVGLNGSGKTTTLECILGLQSFNSGSITLLDRQPADLHLARGR
ncbi:MAG: ATP-binding cassette domain-containing protein, partial [Gammaproteobacteria bacterium]|nr:ATP-binding cassette domain-containing protein [Gammaproteobacteria bacterium]